MPQSLSKLYIHLVFHIKTTSPVVKEDHIDRMFAYIGQLINTTGCKVLKVGGMLDHIHVMFILSKDMSIAKVVEETKRNSSRWLKTFGSYYNNFEWQGGYAAFSVSQSMVPKVLDYIQNQRKHHEHHSFREEYIEFLKLNHIDYDERFVLSD